MNVKDLMQKNVKTCGMQEPLSTAARQMWENDCGCVPVVEGDSRVVGMVTDRDVCMATYFQDRPPAELRVAEAMSSGIFSCGSNDPIETAEKVMRENQIRRLPVIDDSNRIVGILSLNDLALEADRERRSRKERPAVSSEEVAATLAAVCEPRGDRSGVSPV
jgi:CBS domain-containing protein